MRCEDALRPLVTKHASFFCFSEIGKRVFEKLTRRNPMYEYIYRTHYKILDYPKLKADDNANENHILEFVFGRVENIVGKKVCLIKFSSFPTMFSKLLFIKVLKSRY